MLAEEILRQGDLDQALQQLQDAVRKEPAAARYRVFLFQLLAVRGEWDRALKQLSVAGELDPGCTPMVQTYRAVLRDEALRRGVFAGDRTPILFGEPAEWMAFMVEALRATAQGQHAEAGRVRDLAFESAPATSGTIDGVAFEWIADADTRLGPMLEVIVNGHYQWMPFSRVRKICIEAPADLRDLVWTPAVMTLATGLETVGFIPTRYPESESDEDPLVRLAKKTVWAEHEGGGWLGRGQRMLATDQGEYPLMDVREIQLSH